MIFYTKRMFFFVIVCVTFINAIATQNNDLSELISQASDRIYCTCECGGIDISYQEYNKLSAADQAKVVERCINKKFDDIIAKLEHDVRAAIAQGADVNAISSKGDTPLMTATLGGFDTVVRILLEHGADVNIVDEKGLSALDCNVLHTLILVIGNTGPLYLMIKAVFYMRGTHARCAQLLSEAHCPRKSPKEFAAIIKPGSDEVLFTLLEICERNLWPDQLLIEMQKKDTIRAKDCMFNVSYGEDVPS